MKDVLHEIIGIFVYPKWKLTKKLLVLAVPVYKTENKHFDL